MSAPTGLGRTSQNTTVPFGSDDKIGEYVEFGHAGIGDDQRTLDSVFAARNAEFFGAAGTDPDRRRERPVRRECHCEPFLFEM